MRSASEPRGNADSSAQERSTSGHLVRGVDFLFALTIGQGILLYRDFWIDPLAHDHLTVALALAAIYVTTVQSYIDWHLAMERDPYLVAWHRPWKERTFERARFTIDLMIVGTYAFLVVNAVPLVNDPSASLDVFLAGFPVIFALYLIWSILRRKRYRNGGTPVPMAISLCALGALYVVYRADRGAFLGSGADENNIYLIAALVVTACYRLSNSVRGGRWRST
jgi:hypothetical protein